MKHQLNCSEAPASGGFALRPPTGLCPLQPRKIFTCAHVDLGAGLLQYADNRPTIITLVGMVAVGMVRVGMVSVGMVPASRVSACCKLGINGRRAHRKNVYPIQFHIYYKLSYLHRSCKICLMQISVQIDNLACYTVFVHQQQFPNTPSQLSSLFSSMQGRQHTLPRC